MTMIQLESVVNAVVYDDEDYRRSVVKNFNDTYLPENYFLFQLKMYLPLPTEIHPF